MVKTRKLNDFILSVVKSIFQDMVSMDTLIMKIMNFAPETRERRPRLALPRRQQEPTTVRQDFRHGQRV
ncbi:hypothetical protein Pmani_038270 [Petrolisthes manimaculis]|uniref:Uncharacterized protein n=1 Tax=Petrolisthes manimaculis TaxID=1843537 RepID=A0AAE1NG33_9EUCA|nr:hypothetical protein Pmani_038270 [Petrolisthes manimaculis]